MGYHVIFIKDVAENENTKGLDEVIPLVNGDHSRGDFYFTVNSIGIFKVCASITPNDFSTEVGIIEVVSGNNLMYIEFM